MKRQLMNMKILSLTVVALTATFSIWLVPKEKMAQKELLSSRIPDLGAPAVEQARKLLRKVYPLGALGEITALDPAFEQLVGNPVTMTRDQLRSYIVSIGVQEADLGGSFDSPISMTAAGEPAKYFVIHDTSFPTYGSKSFPNEINSSSWQFNSFRQWRSNKVTHLFVNRLGESITITDYADGLTATKYERKTLGEAESKGMCIHIELIQPRKRDKRYWKGNDIECPTPGFTDGQYRRLALLYIAASLRKGSWLIPAFHSCFDHGIHNKHDDPQGFDLDKWLKALLKTVSDIQKPAPAPAQGSN